MKLSNIVIVLLAVFLVACGDGRQWHGKNLSGLMPELAFELTDENGKPVTAKDYRGHPLLMFFGYSFCPDYCPTTLSQLTRALNTLPEPVQADVRILFVSVDPQRDTPAVLKRYSDYFGPQVIGLTGQKDALENLAKRYRTTFGYGDPDSNGNYVVSHGLAVYGFDRSGAVRVMLLDTESQSELAEDIEQLAQLVGA